MILYNFTVIDKLKLQDSGEVHVLVWAMHDNGEKPNGLHVLTQGASIELLKMHDADLLLNLKNLWANNRISSESIIKNLNDEYFYTNRIKVGYGLQRLRICNTNGNGSVEWLDGFDVLRKEKISTKKRVTENKYFLLLKKEVVRTAATIFNYIYHPRNGWIVPLVNPERLGHLAANTDVFLAEHSVGLYGIKKKTPLFFASKKCFVEGVGYLKIKKNIANKALLKEWSENYSFFTRGFLSQSIVEEIRKRNPSAVFRPRTYGHRDIHGCLDITEPSLRLSEKTTRKGDAQLEALGVPSGSKIILFHCRTSEFIKKTYTDLSENFDHMRYGYRNVEVSSYDSAIIDAVKNGYYAVRVGMESTPWHLEGKGFIDCAFHRRHEWMDLYLFNRCEFFCGTTSGIYALADLFRKPIVFTNFAPLGHVYSWSPRHITIFKKLVNKDSGLTVSAREQLGSSIGWEIHGDNISNDKYQYIDNTADEIKDAVEEMRMRCEGAFLENSENDQRQSAFWSQFKPSLYHNYMNSRIGGEFLKQNESWLLP
jgi:putative glycosyltransferase (TIGR04372 family)